MRALLVVLVLAGCSSLNLHAPDPGELFDPKPNHHFHAAAGEVAVIGLSGHVVCFTTDGSAPREVDGRAAPARRCPSRTASRWGVAPTARLTRCRSSRFPSTGRGGTA